jgi:hypothetical protein
MLGTTPYTVDGEVAAEPRRKKKKASLNAFHPVKVKREVTHTYNEYEQE